MINRRLGPSARCHVPASTWKGQPVDFFSGVIRMKKHFAVAMILKLGTFPNWLLRQQPGRHPPTR